MRHKFAKIATIMLFFVFPAKSQYILYGSACTAPSKGFCNTLTFAILLTQSETNDVASGITKPSPDQFGLVRLQNKHLLSSGLDGGLCIHFGSNQKGGDRITFYIQGDTIKQNPSDSCGGLLLPPGYNYFNEISTFLAVEIETVEDDSLAVKFDSIRIYQKSHGTTPQVSLWRKFRAPFDLDTGHNISFRILHDPAQQKLQLYLEDIRVFDECIDLATQVFGQNRDTVFLTMSGQTGTNPDSLAVSVNLTNYLMCPIGICKVYDSEFSNWSQAGRPIKSKWSKNGGLTKTAQDNLSFYMDPCHDWINVRIKFKAQVDISTTHQTGYWGFVWGWQDRFCENPDKYEGYLFGWKHEPSALNGGLQANDARIFAQMQGVIDESQIANHFWANNAGTAWAHLVPPQSGISDWWQAGNIYEFVLEYSVKETKLFINNDLILEVQAAQGLPNQPGQFGFYAYEQSGIVFWDIVYEYLDKFELPDKSICQNVDVPFRVENLASGYDATHIQSFMWIFPDTTPIVLPASNHSILHQFEYPGLYPCALFIETKFNNCTIRLDRNVEVIAFDVPRLPEDTTLCAQEALYLDVFDHKDPKAAYIWSDSSTLSAFTAVGPSYWWVQKTSSDSVCTARDSIKLDYWPAPDIDLSISPACEEQENGTLQIAQILGGTPPFTYFFAGQQSDQMGFNGLGPISDDLVIQDGKGCKYREEVSVGSVPRPSIELQVTHASCHRARNGRVAIVQAPAGLQFSLDGHNFSSNPMYSQLDTGVFVLYYKGVAPCIWDTSFTILEPEPFIVQIQAPSALAAPGDSALLKTTTIPGGFDGQVRWYGPNLACDTCRSTYARPTRSATYRVVLTDAKGCTASDSSILLVPNDTLVYVPNAFHPGDNGPNSRVWVSAFPQVQRIKRLRIFDRTGDLVFERSHFPPNDPNFGWDGFAQGHLLSTGVFMYYLEYEVPGQNKTHLLTGDISLIR